MGWGGGWSKKNIPLKSPISGCNGKNHDFFRQIELHVRQTQQIGTFFVDVQWWQKESGPSAILSKRTNESDMAKQIT